MGRRMHRYVVPVDDEPHLFTLTSSPVFAGARQLNGLVEFWAEHDDTDTAADRWFQVFSTGWPLPDGARWVGTCLVEGLVWHLYEIQVL